MSTIEFLRQFKIGEYAVFDFAASFLGIYLLSPLLSKMFLKIRVDVPKRNWLFLTLPISVLAHLAVGEITPMTRDIIDLNGHYILKAIMLGLLFFGVKGIKISKK
jgi:hypothetical protein